MQRPKKEFATGARTLRGGKNLYTAKTLCGNWVEAQYDPEFEHLARESKYDEKYESTANIDATIRQKNDRGRTWRPVRRPSHKGGRRMHLRRKK